MSISVLGAGAFGTALAVAFARNGSDVTLWSRDADDAMQMQSSRKTGRRLPGHDLPDSVTVTSDRDAFNARTCLVAVPMQKMRGFIWDNSFAPDTALVACAKGVDRTTGLGPVATIEQIRPGSRAGLLTGPSFAADIAQGLPTAVVLAANEDETAKQLQQQLTRQNLRLYRTTDVIGAELGGALKNVIALAAGMAIGAGLGDSARASVISRGFSELGRFALAKGAKSETIQGLSGFGDLVLTCTSEKSRNFAAGVGLGKGLPIDQQKTVEGAATALAVAAEANEIDLDLPLVTATAEVVEGRLDISSAIETLLARPVGTE